MNILFPIAGLGSRFGYVFKPFLLATEDTFIQLAKKPFDVLPNKQFYFIFREQQEYDFNVSKRLYALFPNDIINICIIGDTDGPLQTLQQAIQKYNIKGPSFVCDCDHSINITPMVEQLNKLDNFDVFIPTWEIEPAEYKNWGKIVLDHQRKIVTFCEKEFIEGEKVKGLLGCYLFKSIELLLEYPYYENISDVLKLMHQEHKHLNIIDITEAEFFGTPESLTQFRFNRAKQYTLFIDIEGTLIHQTTKEILPGTLEKLTHWKKQGHSIVLTTATNQERINILLEKYKLPYDSILYDLTPGPRYIINDAKPYIPYYAMAEGIPIPRNKGIQDIYLPNQIPMIKHIFEGASMTPVYLLSNNIVRKVAEGSQIPILKRQCEDMKRFYFYNPTLCPMVLHEHSTPYQYYYDMEYLEDYKPLSHFNNTIIHTTLSTVLKDLHKYIYCFKKELEPIEKIAWMKQFYKEKLIPKYNLLLSYDEIYINHKPYKCVKYYLEKLDIEKFTPDYICPIHGDLTLENIMYHKNENSYKLIDPAGSRYMDAIEMDIGKLLQSLLCNYHDWKNEQNLVTQLDGNSFIIPDIYLQDKYDQLSTLFDYPLYKKGIFYMATYFIRMIPFMENQSKDMALFIQLLAIHWLSTCN